ncbi:MAG: glycosyltransferase family 2 protein [Acidobacteria bacterium]|nr:glycosyltransferase family 2 protein [Acidobacteriota bacterium]
MGIFEIASLIFWANTAAIAYAYAGYPVAVWLAARLRPRRWKIEEMTPRVTMIIAARNEEKAIAEKLENSLALDYPEDKLDFIVVSDASEDATDSIVEAFPDARVKLLRAERRLGKTGAQNLGVEHAEGEILLFSDATTWYEKDVVRNLVRNFADPTIGCVGGMLIYRDGTNTSVGRASADYWGYETFIKRHESLAASLIGVSGCMYAVRRSAYKPMYPEACSDFLIATVMQRQGLRTVFEPEAVCTEETNETTEKELRMRVRVIAQTLSDIWRNRDILNPLRAGFFGFAIVSHKVARYSVPLFLIAAYFANMVLAFRSTGYAILFAGQTVFWGVGLAGMLIDRKRSAARILGYPTYFALANLASLLGIYRFL